MEPDSRPTVFSVLMNAAMMMLLVATTEQYLPSKNAAPEKGHGCPFNPSAQQAKNSGITLQCNDCGKWRLVYAARKVKLQKRNEAEAAMDTILYSCGSVFTEINNNGDDDPEQVTRLADLYVRANLNCASPIELAYDSAGYEMLCIHCVPPALEEHCGRYTHIDLSGNNISMLGNYTFQKCTNLQELYLNASRLSTIEKHAFDGCVRLNLLNVDDNLLRIFPLKLGSLNSLRELSTRRNQFDNIRDTTGLRELGNLTRLYIGPQSQCKDLTTPYNTAPLLALQELDLRDMQLYSMPFILAGELRVLDVSGNWINLPNNVFDRSPHLKILRLRGCHIRVLTAVNKLRQLQELDIRDNPIHPLSVLQQITCMDLSWRLVLLVGERQGPSQCHCWNNTLGNVPQQLKRRLLVICDDTSGSPCFVSKQSWSYDPSRCRDIGMSRRCSDLFGGSTRHHRSSVHTGQVPFPNDAGDFQESEHDLPAGS
uniref:uncharacterized protein n=1 Tax=Myxine glutinosa TaxID=7769 RepID=UPI00359011A5